MANGIKKFTKNYKKNYKVVKKTKYTKKRGSATTNSKLIKEISMMKKMMNFEKKRIDVTRSSNVVAQTNINAQGLHSNDVTPQPTQGTGFGNRVGSQIKVVSMYATFQFWSQTNNNHETNLIIEIFKFKGVPEVVSSFITQYYNVNPVTTIIDYNSARDPDYFGSAYCVCSRKVKIKVPQYSGQVQITNYALPLRLQSSVRFDDNTSTITDGQFIICIRADSGNWNSVTSTLSNIPIQTASSGLTFNYDIKWYYYDH